MRSLRLISCGMAAAILTAASTVAQSPSAPAAAESADRFTNRELMAQPERERQVWLSALTQGLATGVASLDSEAGACLSRWYFGDEAQAYANVVSNMERYPDYHPAVVVMALARRECPSLNRASAREQG